MEKQRRNATGDRVARLDAAVPGWRALSRKPRSKTVQAAYKGS
jgi:hypothetical protein